MPFKSSKITVTTKLLALFLALVSTGFLATLAASLLKTGIEYYKSGDYLRARRFFQMYLQRKPESWPAHYELANTYVKMNEPRLARKEYMACLNARPDQKTAVICGRMVTFLDTRLSDKAHVPVPVSEGGTHTPVQVPETKSQTEFKHRVYVVKPKFNHPAVRQETINLVTQAVNSLPPLVYNALDRGQATVNISPNMVDKWPDSLKNMDSAGLKLAQDAARCYAQNVYIYERPLIAGTNRLGQPFDEVGIRNVLYHELGHATDWSLGKFSNTPEVLKIHKSDIEVMPYDVKSRLWYYTKDGFAGCKEAVAESFAGLMGAHGKDTALVVQYFPRLRAWVKDRLKL